MAKNLEIGSLTKTITKSEIKKLMNEGFSVRTQSNGLVFVGKKTDAPVTRFGEIKHRVLCEDVYRLVSE